MRCQVGTDYWIFKNKKSFVRTVGNKLVSCLSLRIIFHSPYCSLYRNFKNVEVIIKTWRD